jgi:beta-lactamase regulating signal transducer with metallopeptidase domain
MIPGLDFSAVAQTVAARAADSLVIGVLVVVFALMLLRLSRRQTSAERFAVWFSALSAIAVLTWLDGAFGLLAGSHAATLSENAAITVPGSWAIYLFVAWAGIAGTGLGRVAIGLWNVHTLRRSLALVDVKHLADSVRETLERQPRSRSAVLCTSERVNVPTAVGFVKPAVVIPAWLMNELSTEELNQIVLHELAHLRRWDDWTNLAQKIVKALFFFHPAVWWIEKKISLEREIACDDVVLAESASPQSYAACLVHLAEKSALRRGIALVQAAVGRVRQTSLRVAQILNGDRLAAGRISWQPAISLAAVFAVVCVVGIARAPRLIAFNDVRPSAALASSLSASLPSITPKVQLASDAIRTSAFPLANGVPKPAHAIKAIAMFHSADPRPGSYAASDLRWTRTSRLSPNTQAIHKASFRQNPAAAKAMFVVLEQDEYELSGNSVRGVRVWYILLLNPPDDSAHGIPRKET